MILIKNALIYTMEKDEIIKNGDILIENGKIIKIEKDIQTDSAKVIDVNGKMVLPGFIDAHCHLGMWEDAIGFEGADGNEATNPITPHLRAIDAINPMDRTFEEAREAGVTLVATGPGSANVIGGMFTAIKTYGDRIDDMIVKDPLAMKCAFGENPKNVYNDKKTSPSTRMAIAAELRNAIFTAKEYLSKKEAAGEDLSKMPDFDMKKEALIPVLKKEIPLKAHAHRADDILTAIRIAKEFDLNLTLEHCTEGHLIVDYLVKEGYPAIVGPSLSDRSKFELKNLTFDTPGILSKAGMKIAIMTDAPVIPLQYLPMAAALSVKSGMDENEALKAITINPAEILGLEETVGSIKVGKDADIVIWHEHPFKLEAKPSVVMINGEIVYENN
ncbi:MAG: amidohydrolase [Bacillota bacterium]|nr:amidohydrolase [Bacillota bacterium]